ncbi:unnamed protein product [Adineta steineri]|uniref:Uncharacterized protein n=1 Tax=Adineta steineri TaxID=433720 RepID=A0A819LW52_9BILA|nr:unnamed protein product [Adineta steineri]CAF1282153.1 unnamed protein product [Adineta steineri]CAF1339991.1 unnamed protein product [Adineta steineri]CAF3621496.1 unnamed protein product [Adineta steineri]CAF3968393.1 unnamed protein product [Adineta steineri]
MRLTIGCALFFVVIAFVQSNPIFNGMNDLNAVINQLGSQTALNDLMHNLSGQVANAISSSQLQALVQQALQLAPNVMNGSVKPLAAAIQLFAQLQQQLGSNTQLLDAVTNAMQQLGSALLTIQPNLLSGLGTRSAVGKQLQISDLEAMAAQYPQYSSVVASLAALANPVVAALTKPQLQALESLALQLAPHVITGSVKPQDAVDQLLTLLKQFLGDNHLFDSVSSVFQQMGNFAA